MSGHWSDPKTFEHDPENQSTTLAQSMGMREALEDIWGLTSNFSQYTLEHFARKVRAKVDAALAAQPPAAPVETKSNQLAAGTGPATRDGLSPERSIPPHPGSSAGNGGDDPSRSELIESIQYAIGALSMHIEAHHDFDYAPHQVPIEVEELRRLQHHLEGSLISSKGENCTLNEPQTALVSELADVAESHFLPIIETLRDALKKIMRCGDADDPEYQIAKKALAALSLPRPHGGGK